MHAVQRVQGSSLDRAWTLLRVLGVAAGLALAARQLLWVLGAGWTGHWSHPPLFQVVLLAASAAPGAFLGIVGALTLAVARDDGSRGSRATWVMGLVLVALGFLWTTGLVGWAPPDPAFLVD